MTHRHTYRNINENIKIFQKYLNRPYVFHDKDEFVQREHYSARMHYLQELIVYLDSKIEITGL